jgi:hypothetical protein
MEFWFYAALSYLCVFWLAKFTGRIKQNYVRRLILGFIAALPLLATFFAPADGIAFLLIIALIPYWLLWCIVAFAGYRLQRN